MFSAVIHVVPKWDAKKGELNKCFKTASRKLVQIRYPIYRKGYGISIIVIVFAFRVKAFFAN